MIASAGCCNGVGVLQSPISNATEIRPGRERARLRNEVVVATLVKLLALFLISALFFSASQRPKVDADSIMNHLERPAATH
ncbi:MAG TPA: hypothetical protein VGM59_06445 [Dongiaceae bacterium]|jgi:hypothetical protein